MFARRCSALAATFVVALAAALTTAPLEAQMTIGLRAGVGAGTQSGEGTDTRGASAFDDPRYGLVAGVDAGIPLFGPLGVRIGAELARKGGAAEIPASITSGRLLTKAVSELDYAQFSALLRASVGAEGGELSFGLLAGPYVALNLSCNVAVTTIDVGIGAPPVPPGEPNIVPATRVTSAADAEVACGEDGVSEVKSNEYGLAFGGGFEAKLSDSLRLGVDLIYAMGLSEIDDEGKKNNHVALLAGLVFPIG